MTEAQSTPTREAFVESVTKLVGYNWSEPCCEQHRGIFQDLQVKARAHLETKGAFSQAQLNFAREMAKGNMSHSGQGRVMDPNQEVTTRCVHTEMVDAPTEGEPNRKKVVRCEAMINGTRKELGAAGTKCKKH